MISSSDAVAMVINKEVDRRALSLVGSASKVDFWFGEAKKDNRFERETEK